MLKSGALCKSYVLLSTGPFSIETGWSPVSGCPRLESNSRSARYSSLIKTPLLMLPLCRSSRNAAA